jgi:hypothetical protein
LATDLIEDALSACRVSVTITCNALVNLVVVDVRVEHGLDTSFETKLRIIDLSAGLDELGHAYTKDIDGLLLADHDGGL